MLIKKINRSKMPSGHINNKLLMEQMRQKMRVIRRQQTHFNDLINENIRNRDFLIMRNKSSRLRRMCKQMRGQIYIILDILEEVFGEGFPAPGGPLEQ